MAIKEQLLADGRLKPHLVVVGKDGLEGVLNGTEDMENG